MDPNSGRIYDEKQIADLPPEIQERLIRGEREELEKLREHILATESQGINPTMMILDEAQAMNADGEIDVQKTAEELEEILEAMANIKTMPNEPPERFYPINRAARRAAEKRERKQKFVNKPGGKVRGHGS